MDLTDKLREEFARAENARLEGNEGRARVCARRAAGWAAKEHLEQAGDESIKASGFANLLKIGEREDLPDEIRKVISRLTTNLEVENESGEEEWPDDLDLISDAHKLVSFLLPQLSF